MEVWNTIYVIRKEHRFKPFFAVERDAYQSYEEAEAAIRRKCEAMYPDQELEKICIDTFTVANIIMYYIQKVCLATN